MSNKLCYVVSLLSNPEQRISYITSREVAEFVSFGEGTSEKYMPKESSLLWASGCSLIRKSDCLVSLGYRSVNCFFGILLFYSVAISVNGRIASLLPKSVGVVRKTLSKTSHMFKDACVGFQPDQFVPLSNYLG